MDYHLASQAQRMRHNLIARIWRDARFVDTHCHFDFPPFTGDEEQSIAKAAEAGVQAIIVPAIEAANFERVLNLAQHHRAISAALACIR
jgi:Tat protein secretion system quality control protein TatD with DNase activity